MKTNFSLLTILILVLTSCSKNANFTPEFMEQTAGSYLYNQDDIIEVYYEDSKMYLKWRNAKKLEPLVLDDNVIFLSDLYKKLHFVTHPESKKHYLSVIQEDESKVTYDYLKVDDTYKTPSMYLRDKNFEKAAEGFLAIRAQDSTTELVNEYDINNRGYRYLNDEDYENAIGVFKMNVLLFPESDNVYDSLADAYLRSGDSIQAYHNYSKALDLNPNNRRAEQYLNTYKIETAE